MGPQRTNCSDKSIDFSITDQNKIEKTNGEISLDLNINWPLGNLFESKNKKESLYGPGDNDINYTW